LNDPFFLSFSYSFSPISDPPRATKTTTKKKPSILPSAEHAFSLLRACTSQTPVARVYSTCLPCLPCNPAFQRRSRRPKPLISY
jgi:hypothetical protein